MTNRSEQESSSPFAKTLSKLTNTANAFNKCSERVVSLHFVQSNNSSFENLRRKLFWEAKSFGDRILPRTLTLTDKFRSIASTAYEAVSISSSRLVNDLLSNCEKAESEARKLAVIYTVLADRLTVMEPMIETEKKKLIEKRGFGVRQAITNMFWAGTSRDATGDKQDFDILQSALDSLKTAILLMQQFIQSVWDLSLLLVQQRGRNLLSVVVIHRNQQGNMNYSDVVASQKAIVEECARFRNEYKNFMQGLDTVGISVPDDIRKEYMWQVEQGSAFLHD